MTKMILIPVTGPIREVTVETAEQMGEHIGARYIERVRVARDWALAVDENGQYTDKPRNDRAGILYGTPGHGVPIVGDVLIAREGPSYDGVGWVDTSLVEAEDWLSERGALA